MKKILMIGPFSKQINGMTVANKMLYSGLESQYQVELIDTLKDEKFENKENQGKFRLFKLIKIIKCLYRELYTIARNPYDYIYMTPGQSFYGFSRFIPYMLFAILKKRKFYLHIHGSKFREMYDEQSKLKRYFIEFFLVRSNGVIVLGDSLKFMFNGLIPHNKIYICENGVENTFVGKSNEIKRKIDSSVNDSKLNILYLSNLMEDKGILSLMKASESFNEEEILINLAGEIEPNIEKEISEYFKKESGKIVYNGVVDGAKKKELLLKSDVLVLPSKDEGQPISILEAYANACLVITDEKVGGISDIFSDVKNGYSCDHNDYLTIVEGLKKLKSNKVAMRNNYNYFIENFSEEEFVRRIVNIFEHNKKV